MSTLILVSNRLPLSVERKKGKPHFTRSIGGVATGLERIHRAGEKNLWIGWPGIARERLSRNERQRVASSLLETDRALPVWLAHDDIEKHYNGFCNGTLWPLFHTFPQYVRFRKAEWESYRRVNEQFSKMILQHATDGDTVWIHDFHLLLLPQLLRQANPTLTIGFFLHIPFPSFELIRMLPWRNSILSGMAGADLVGFHTYDDALHYLKGMQRILGVDHEVGQMLIEGRTVTVDAFPLGIDFDRYVHLARTRSTAKAVRQLRRDIGDRSAILSLDRLDYTKGITRRLEAFRRLLQREPQYRGKVVLLLVVPPSRTKVRQYRDMRREIDELAGGINGAFGTLEWTPVRYLSRSFDAASLVSLYVTADIALVTPLRDGMNLIAKEYLACRTGNSGVLVLSEMAGAAKELSEAVIVNPAYEDSIVNGLVEALRMPKREQLRRNKVMRASLRRRTADWWAQKFLTALAHVKELQGSLSATYMNDSSRTELINRHRNAKRRLLLLDYDGSLVPFRSKPDQAVPSQRVLRLLRKLSERGEVVVTSGRLRRDLHQWFSKLPIGLMAEHGTWVRKRGGEWERTQELPVEWKENVRDVLQQYMDITPGSFIEEKDYALAWHCRMVDPELRAVRTRDLMGVLRDLTASIPLDIHEGKRVIEVKHVGVDKGKGALQWLRRKPFDFLFAMGDDWTDEDLFSALPADALTVKVGPSPSIATYRLPTHMQMLSLLEAFAENRVGK
ncbi:MAG: bifunctional alpha,alpha-trehalose-phosphate synthase (UDP-forming)/trehalose-phosphatase [Candidatus Peribacteraceae bacterium]|jgi:trehalose 6-phosphate synthase/phosphatase